MKRLVIKIGSALIAPQQDGCRSQHLLKIAQFIVDCRSKGIEVILVSSGAVAAGAHLFAKEVQQSVAVRKAMAAAGQTEMISMWERFFDFPTAQLLLTHADLRHRERYTSIRETLFTLLAEGILPIINENDAVTTDSLKVGDNDNLSAMVAAAADADSLVICSDIDGLYNANPRVVEGASLIPEVRAITDEIKAMTDGPNSAQGTGGMRTKLQAAEKATSHGITTYIVNGFKDSTFRLLLEGQNPGTVFFPYDEPLLESQHWLMHTAKAQGELVVSAQLTKAEEPLAQQVRSDDIVAVNGEFSAGETVLITDPQGNRLAKAKTNYSSCLLSFIAQHDSGLLTSQMQESIGPVISQQHIAVLEK
ncbi:glutamate 5-kinase [Pseudoalteromonas fenneropenaei]|uniref:Glutamate 5-kinase n=1 Tax=Pseudoalteromonas fenneropenaei TaxID=1737459 RepID=A0ABV7CKJ6_9GAMM